MVDVNPIKSLPFLQKGVAQVALVVKDLEQTVENYHKYFGIGPVAFLHLPKTVC